MLALALLIVLLAMVLGATVHPLLFLLVLVAIAIAATGRL